MTTETPEQPPPETPPDPNATPSAASLQDMAMLAFAREFGAQALSGRQPVNPVQLALDGKIGFFHLRVLVEELAASCGLDPDKLHLRFANRLTQELAKLREAKPRIMRAPAPGVAGGVQNALNKSRKRDG